ncbi:Dynactin subunit 3 [Rhizophlyctis rosea]|nr:Dynactin subunit 3 [Rhizophlyctis rosea]
MRPQQQDLTNQVSQLEERLRHLEALTAPKLLSSGNREVFEESVLSSVENIQGRLLQITEERSAIGDFLMRYEQLRDLLQNQSDEIERSALDVHAKKAVVLASEEDLLQIAEQLRDIDSLKDELDAPVLQELETLVPKLSPIEARNIEQSEYVGHLRERFLEALDSYNQFVTLISEVFIWYQDVISSLERTVQRLENQQRIEEED